MNDHEYLEWLDQQPKEYLTRYWDEAFQAGMFQERAKHLNLPPLFTDDGPTVEEQLAKDRHIKLGLDLPEDD